MHFFNINSARVRTREVSPSSVFFKFCLYCITVFFFIVKVFNIFVSVLEQFFRAIISGIVFLTYFLQLSYNNSFLSLGSCIRLVFLVWYHKLKAKGERSKMICSCYPAKIIIGI